MRHHPLALKTVHAILFGLLAALALSAVHTSLAQAAVCRWASCDVTVPSVGWKTPAASATVAGLLWEARNSGPSGPCEVTAADNVGVSKVVFSVDGTLLNTENVAPYNCKFDSTTVADGSHTLKAVAYDVKGNTATSLRTVTVKNTPDPGDVTAPSVSWKTPAADATVSGLLWEPTNSGASGPCEAGATDNVGVSKVVFYVDGTLLNTEDVAPYNCKLDSTTVADGSHTLKAVAYDVKGNTATSLRTVTVKNTPDPPADTTAPTVSWTKPAADATVSGFMWEAANSGPSGVCEVSASDNVGVSKVIFHLDGALLHQENAAPYNCKFDTTTVDDGSHTLKAVAYDAAGTTATSSRTVNVDNVTDPPPADTTAPTASWTSPAADATIAGLLWESTNSGSSGPCQVSASDNVGVSNVVFSIDATQLNTDSTAPYNCKLDTMTVANGTHTLKAVASDAVGNVITTTRPVSVSNNVPNADVSVSVDRSTRATTSKLELGVTTTQYSLDAWGDATAIANGQKLLDGAVTYQNQFIYGWGVDNPNPSPGVYKWTRMDARMQMLRGRANAVPVFTLTGAPDWMTSQGTNTSNFNLQSAPTAAHYDDFAELARQIALRYSSPSNAKPVLHYQVWSELRGMFSSSLKNHDYVAYTTLYNKVYDALKSVNPNIKVGGPYMVLEGTGSTEDLGTPSAWYTGSPISTRQQAFLDYWFKNKRGAQFISIDKGGKDYNDPNSYTTEQRFKLLHWFGDAVRRLRALPGYAGEPVWWSEGFTWADTSNRLTQRASEAASLREMLLADTNVMLKWQDNGTYNGAYGFYTDTRYAGGGQAYPNYTAYKVFHDTFPLGTPVYKPTSSAPTKVVAVSSSTKTVLINQTNITLTVAVGGVVVTLTPYDVKDVSV